MDMAQVIRETLEEAFRPEAIRVEDESDRHAGHAGARGGGGHFRVLIVAPCFEGMSPLARHRAIYAALGERMGTAIHALAIVARAPSERPPTA